MTHRYSVEKSRTKEVDSRCAESYHKRLEKVSDYAELRVKYIYKVKAGYIGNIINFENWKSSPLIQDI